MDTDLISLIDVAKQHGKQKQHVFKIVRRLGIETVKKRNSSNRNQFISYVDQNGSLRIAEALSTSQTLRVSASDDRYEDDGFVSNEIGVFYFIQLEPNLDPSRFKVGFSATIDQRLRDLRCSAPFAKVVKHWPCRRLWEKTAIDCISSGCERLHTEVFRTALLEDTLAKCETFFDLMPSISDQR